MPRGTTERGRDSQRRIADALVELVVGGDPAPTARAIAERAGVSLRLVFHHFESLEDVYRLAVVRLTVQHVDTLVPVEARRPLAERIDQTVRRWARVYEEVGSMWRAANSLGATMPSLPPALALGDAVLAEHLRETFASEIETSTSAAGATGSAPEEVFQLLYAVLSFEAWDRLRRVQALTTSGVRRALVFAVTALLSASTASS